MALTKIFITGGTGYIGGTVIRLLLDHPDAKSFTLSALVRTTEQAEKIKTLGITPIIGSYADLDILSKAASEADIVFAIANADDLNAANAILKGLKQTFAATGKAPILIHTSGIASLADDARGNHADQTAYSDLSSDRIEALPETALHRNVDIALVKADREGYVKAYIVTPGCVFGPANGPLVDLGIQKLKSRQIVMLLQTFIAHKKAGYRGLGKNIWSFVGLEDTASLYIIIFDAVRKNPDSTGHGRDGYYYVENIEYSGYELAETAGKKLFELGILEKAEPSPYSEEELDKYFGAIGGYLGTNCRARGDRSRALGWKPAEGRDAFVEHIESQIIELTKST